MTTRTPIYQRKIGTASASDPVPYIGRFAPSPTGPLHLGSLYTALAGFLDARKHNGQWLLRIDDLDTPRNVFGAVESIIHDLESFGLHWDQQIFYQSQSLHHYHSGIDQLLNGQQLYPCTCTRKSLAEATLNNPHTYPGFCRNKRIAQNEPHALRIKTYDATLSFHDQLQGDVSQDLSKDPGDFIVKRKDRIIAYQFAVVIDDFQQHITRVVRGYDLLDSTPRQLFIQQLLSYSSPEYMHVPVIVDQHGTKLSKQTHAEAVNTEKPAETLFLLLTLLKQNPPDNLRKATVADILDWAVAHWNPQKLKKIRAIH